MNSDIYFEEEGPKYQKKSTKKGQPRADHKHEYEVSLLTTYAESNTFPGGTELTNIVKICTTCGRVGEYINDKSYYDYIKLRDNPLIYEKKLNEKALALPKWHAEGWFPKFAIKGERENE